MWSIGRFFDKLSDIFCPLANKLFVLEGKMLYPSRMSQTVHGNGNGNGHSASPSPPARKPAITHKTAPAKNSEVSFQTSTGMKLRGQPGRFTREAATFELHGGDACLRTSEILAEFRLCIQGKVIYSGPATVSNLIDEGGKTICDAALEASHWIDADFLSALQQGGSVATEFEQFMNEWGKIHRVSPNFKIIVADMQAFLHDLRLWVDRVESNINSAPPAERSRLEKNLAQQIGRRTSPKLTAMFEKFEACLQQVEPQLANAYGFFAQRLLHPYLLCSPFLHRTFFKPLGYAGDYEMVNMLSRDPFEGGSLYAKIINLWFWEQPPAEAHRNRLKYLAKQIENEALRQARSGRPAQVFNFACGPAIEIQNFLKESTLREHVSFTLADFNSETLRYTQRSMEGIKAAVGAQTPFEFQNKSVLQLLKESESLAARKGGAKPRFDFVYCAGLFDYLSDRTCLELMNAFYNFVAPGGLLVATNVDSFNPRQPTMNHIMAWHLIYRNARDFATLRPSLAAPEDCSIKADATGVNIFLEVRKPDHA